LKPFSAFDGEAGKNSEPPKQEVDYIAAQFAVAFTDRRMIVSNRFQVSAYDLKDGKRAWQSALGAEQGATFQWPGVPMSPVVTDQRIFVRRLLSTGPELACLDAEDGRGGG
jgi:outer membrane protein assembly factor BamB